MSRAVDCKTAEEVLVADALATLGAAASLIGRLTGFGRRWIRVLVRGRDGPFGYKLHDAAFFESDVHRRHHAWVSVVLYESQPANLSPGARLVGAYVVYRSRAVLPGLLTINEFAQVVELYERRDARLRECSNCHGEHLVFRERSLCPLCQMVLRTFCRCCGRQLEDNVRHTTFYCPACSKSPARVSARRRARRRQLALMRVGTPARAVGFFEVGGDEPKVRGVPVELDTGRRAE